MSEIVSCAFHPPDPSLFSTLTLDLTAATPAGPRRHSREVCLVFACDRSAVSITNAVQRALDGAAAAP